MKIFLTGVLTVTMMLAGQAAEVPDLAENVDPFIGTAGTGLDAAGEGDELVFTMSELP